MPLTVTQIKTAKQTNRRSRLSDGGGLYIEISPTGVKAWKLDYRAGGKFKTITLGRWPDHSLAEARAWREECKTKLRGGVDPAREAKEEKRALSCGDTFEAVAKEWLAKQEGKWKPRYHKWVVGRFEADVYPVFGSVGIADVSHADILDLIDRFEKRDVGEIAQKTLNFVSKVFGYAIASARATTNPVPNARPAMKPKPKTRHYAKLPASRLPEFYGKLTSSGADPVTTLAMRWTILTMVRTNETRFAKLHEIENRGTKDLLWRIPPGRMKMDREHLVPLPAQAEPLLDKIDALRKATGSEWMFPQTYNAEKPISENCMLYCLYDLGYKGVATMHGFRGVASTVLNEQTSSDGSRLFDRDWIEMQLAHDEADDVRGAYNAAEYLVPRRRMMTWWGQYLEDQEAMGTLL